MHVLPGQAVAKLVAAGAPDHVGAGRQQPLDDHGGALRGGMGLEPIGMAEAGAVTLDIEQVLGREAQARERALARSRERGVVIATKGTQGIVGGKVKPAVLDFVLASGPAA